MPFHPAADPAQVAHSLLQYLTKRAAAPGESLWRAGDEARECYIIEKGSVRVSGAGRGGAGRGARRGGPGQGWAGLYLAHAERGRAGCQVRLGAAFHASRFLPSHWGGWALSSSAAEESAARPTRPDRATGNGALGMRSAMQSHALITLHDAPPAQLVTYHEEATGRERRLLGGGAAAAAASGEGSGARGGTRCGAQPAGYA